MDIGQQIDEFTITRFIARGGMADVYEARQEELKRLVAIKILLPAYAEQKELALRFQREGQAAARLNHANIIQVYATGATLDGLPYIAMEYCSQGTLSDWLERLAQHGQLLRSEQALAIGRQIADALRVAHEAHIVHRDLKPSNILIRQDGSVVLADLGIAVVTSATRITSTGTILGTPQYMSPEQARGARIDGRSDFYSLGIISYEMLSGVRPFDAEQSLAILHQHIYKAAVPLQRHRPGLSRNVYSLVWTCLQKKPETRFQSASHLVAAFDDILRSIGVTSRIFHPGIWPAPGDRSYLIRQIHTRKPRGTDTRPGRPWYIFAIIPVIIALIVIGAMLVTSDNPDTSSSLLITEITDESVENGKVEVIPAESIDIVAPEGELPPIIKIETPEPEQEIQETSPTDTVEESSPNEIPTLPGLDNLADTQIAFVSDRDGLDAIYLMPPGNLDQASRLTSPSGYDWWPAWCGSGSLVFELGDDGWEAEKFEIAMVNADGTDMHIVTSSGLPQGSDMNGSPSCSPDGRYLALSSRARDSLSNDFKVGVVNLLETNRRFDLIGDGYSLGGHVGWAPDSSAVVFMHYQSEERKFAIYQVNLNDPYRPINLSPGIEGSCKYPDWSPDGQYISFACNRRVNNELVWDLVITPPDQPSISVLLQDLHTGAERHDDRQVVRHALKPSWSPDSQWIVLSSDRDGDWDIYVLSLQNGELVNLTEGWSSDEFHPRWGGG